MINIIIDGIDEIINTDDNVEEKNMNKTQGHY